MIKVASMELLLRFLNSLHQLSQYRLIISILMANADDSNGRETNIHDQK